jgi:ketosteroid isomerase-like protein
MSVDPITLVREWLDLAAIGPAEGWVGKVAEDVVVRLPYAPPGVMAEMRGFDVARDTLGAHWASKERFDWHDVVIRRTDDPELFVTTARSEALIHGGIRYANDYVMLTRVRDGRIVEHIEYFDPLRVIAMIEQLSGSDGS